MNNPQEERYHRIADHVLAWAGRVAANEDTVDEVAHEMRNWVGMSPERLWGLCVSAVGCLKDHMQVSAIAQTGNLLAVHEGSWFIKAMTGPSSREPDVVAAMQTAIAMLNRDADMAHDLLIAHEQAGGPMALFGVALVATGAVASLLEAQGFIITDIGNLGDWRF